MADNLQTAFQMNFHELILVHFNQHFMKYIPYGITGKKSALDELKAWCLTGDKPLPELVLTKMHEAIGRLMTPMVSDILFNTDSRTGMRPCWHQAITSTSPVWLLIEPSKTLWHQRKMDGIFQAAFRMHFL